VVANNVQAGEIKNEVLKNKNKIKFGSLILKFEMFDLYKGNTISDNEKSLAFMVFMQDTKKTLEDNIVESLVQEIVRIIESKFSAQLRR
jgi:phenylalanyl-tRNA synthetase beta chain